MDKLKEKEKQKLNQILVDNRINQKNILGIFLYGSQALGLTTEDSDIDTLIIIRPKPKELFDGNSKIKEIIYSNNEKVVILPVNTLIKMLDRMEMQLIEAMHYPIYISDEFNNEFALIKYYLESDYAKAKFRLTLFFFGESFLKHYETKDKENYKNNAKVYLYYCLNQAEDPLLYYRKNKVPELLKEKYISLKSGNESLLNYEDNVLLAISDYYKYNKTTILDSVKEIGTSHELYKLKESFVYQTIKFCANLLDKY